MIYSVKHSIYRLASIAQRLYIYIYIFSGRGFKSHSSQLFIPTSKNPSEVNTIYTTEFRSDADWVIRPWVQVALRANFVQLLQLPCLFSVRFHFGYCLPQSLRWFGSKFSWGNHISVAEWMIRMVFTTKEFFEEVIERYPEWDLKHDHPLNFVQTL